MPTNSAPTVSAGPDRTIPKGTPFALTAVATDPNAADFPALTYNWEQSDIAGTYSNNGTVASYTDSADPATATTADIDGIPRGATPDMGVFESP